MRSVYPSLRFCVAGSRAPRLFQKNVTELPVSALHYHTKSKKTNVSTCVDVQCMRTTSGGRSARTGQPACHERQQLSDRSFFGASTLDAIDALRGAGREVHCAFAADRRPKCTTSR